VATPGDTTGVIEIPGPWQHRYVAANGARFHVAESVPPGVDDPPLVVLLHGFPEFWWSWRGQLPALAAAGYRAAAMDLRGYGGSDKTPRGYDPVTLAQDVAGVVKALGERRAVVVGHGWGGYVGWVAAALHPREVAALCVVSAPHPRVMLRSLRPRSGVAALTHVLAMQLPLLPERRLADPRSRFLRAHLRQWSGPGSAFPDEAAVATYQNALALWPAPHCALEYHRWLVRSRLRADGRRFNQLMEKPVDRPVCAIQGQLDPALPAGVDSRTERLVAGTFRRHVMAGAGHFPHEEQPEPFNDLLVGWLREVAPG
jgi:pimeloyl-ACP methyl ester carboxylesterase